MYVTRIDTCNIKRTGKEGIYERDEEREWEDKMKATICRCTGRSAKGTEMELYVHQVGNIRGNSSFSQPLRLGRHPLLT